MLYLAIDQHKHQLTINVRNEQGDVIQKKQVSTKHTAIDEFFAAFTQQAQEHRGYMSIVEVCGFNDWLIKKLHHAKCSEIIVVQPNRSVLNKTDKRDADALGAFLWNNSDRLIGGQRPHDIQRVILPGPNDAAVRQLANFRQHLVRHRTMIINKIKGILNKHNLSQDAPTQDYTTKKFRVWLKAVELPDTDRFEIDSHIRLWESCEKEILEVESALVKRAEESKAKLNEVYCLKAIPGISAIGAITLLSRIGDIERFKNPDSLANYFGLTPGCHDTGKHHQSKPITKRGSAIARNVLNFAVNHIVRKDPAMKEWHKKIKKKKGLKTARVAVMRRLATIIWHMLRWGKPYQFRYDPPPATPKKDDLRSPKEVLEGIDNSHHSQKTEKGKGKTPSKCRSKTKA